MACNSIWQYFSIPQYGPYPYAFSICWLMLVPLGWPCKSSGMPYCYGTSGPRRPGNWVRCGICDLKKSQEFAVVRWDGGALEETFRRGAPVTEETWRNINSLVQVNQSVMMCGETNFFCFFWHASNFGSCCCSMVPPVASIRIWNDYPPCTVGPVYPWAPRNTTSTSSDSSGFSWMFIKKNQSKQFIERAQETSKSIGKRMQKAQGTYWGSADNQAPQLPRSMATRHACRPCAAGTQPPIEACPKLKSNCFMSRMHNISQSSYPWQCHHGNSNSLQWRKRLSFQLRPNLDTIHWSWRHCFRDVLPHRTTGTTGAQFCIHLANEIWHPQLKI